MKAATKVGTKWGGFDLANKGWTVYNTAFQAVHRKIGDHLFVKDIETHHNV